MRTIALGLALMIVGSVAIADPPRRKAAPRTAPARKGPDPARLTGFVPVHVTPGAARATITHRRLGPVIGTQLARALRPGSVQHADPFEIVCCMPCIEAMRERHFE